MFNKKLTKLVALVLTLVMTMYLFPLDALAYELNSNLVDPRLLEGEPGTIVSGESEIPAEIVTELVSSRDEYQKEFLLDTGHRMYVIYPSAVHYEDDGKWLEIDNTLHTSTVDGETVYTNTAGIWDVILPQSIGVGKTIEVQHNGYTLGMSFLGKQTNTSDTDISSSNISANDEVALITELPKTSTAIIENGTVEFTDTTDTLLAEVSSNKLGSAVTYNTIFNDVDLRYDLISNTLKESIIVNVEPSGEETYSYLLTADNMTMELQDNNSIFVYAEDAGEDESPIFYMPAPYMTDKNGVATFDIDVTLTDTSKGYILTYTPSYEWMSADDRAYPVVIDPVVKPDITIANTSDHTVFSASSMDPSWGMVECGYYSTTGIARTFIKYENLPELTSSDMIVNANMSMYKLYNSSNQAYIEVHKVKSSWTEETLTWSNKPAYNTTVEDFALVGASGWYNWDVTDIAKSWYTEDHNYGMMFKAESSVETAGTNNYKQFCSSDFGGTYMPVLTITYINNNGLEDYWDYTTLDAGRAGSGYINNYTGNLVWVHQDLGFDGTRMPVSISHIYNVNDKNSNDFGMGYGWRTNFNQSVKQWEDDPTYYVWDDEDGTKHYFKYKSANTYEDELGTGLILTTNGSGTTKFCITDKNNNKTYFDSNGRLSQISNYQATVSSILITYTTTSGKLISTITDGAGRVYKFTYNSNGLLSKIAFYGNKSTEITSLTYEYTTDTCLEYIRYPDGECSFYSYLHNTLLTDVVDIDDYYLYFTYTGMSSDIPNLPNRVRTVTASDSLRPGGNITITYGHNQTSIVDHNGNEEIYQFNYWGNTVSVQDGLGRAQFATYVTDDPEVNKSKANQLSLSSKLQNTVSNLARNSSFESNGYWTTNSSNASTGSWGYSTSQSYLGLQSLYITRTSNNTEYRIQPTSNSYFTIKDGETYTVSAYVKTTGMSNTGSGAMIGIASTSEGLLRQSQSIKINSDWTRLEVSYTRYEGFGDATAYICLINNSVGTAYFDCVQVERSSSASRYNIIENGDFIYAGSTSTDAYGWLEGDGCGSTENRTTYSDNNSATAHDAAAPQLDTNVYTATGTYNIAKRCYQNIPISGNAGDVYTIAGWAKGDSVPLSNTSRRFGILVRFYNTNGTQSEILMDFNDDARSDIDWQYAAERVIAPYDYTSIRVLVVYEHNANVVYFDGIQLFKEEFGHSYVYDDDGNVTSVIDLQAQETTYEYDSNSRLVKMTLPTGAFQSYTYDTYGNVLTSTSLEGVVSTFTYDTYGNNLSVTVGEGNQKITTSATYTSNNNQLNTVVDTRGNTTTYGYDANTGVLNWVQAPGETEATRTNYTYDNLYRTTSIAKGSTSNTYTYTGDMLTQSSSAGETNYTYTYTWFDLVSNVKVGNRTLISHTYSDDNNRYLTRSDYGNGDYVTYSYDDYGRITLIGYENKLGALGYVYDNDGNVGVMYDYVTHTYIKNYYDMQGRMTGYFEEGDRGYIRVNWGYNDLNNLSSLTYDLNEDEHTESYTYDDDNRITKITHGNVSSSYTYDTLSRMTEIINKSGNTSVVTTSINYLNPTTTTTSALISSWTNHYASTNIAYTYVYDNRGNITSTSDGTYTTTYVYDQYDQLTRENNQKAGKTWTYTYDTAGNILSKKEYAYTTGTLGTPVDTISYGYTDATWKELLTSYDGKTISYDGIGNMTSDGTWSYTWEHGRQLAVMSDGSTTVEYFYSAEGLREAKRVGNTLTDYFYVGDQLVEMIHGTDTLHFTYDAIGASTVTYNGTTYYYLRNAQGDIVGIVNTSGTVVVSYTYDAWGNVLSITGSMANTLGTLNPLRYRGYIYDEETGLYYVSTRYYDPEIGRFICADVFTSTGQGTNGANMYAYCGNNPVIRIDSTGTFFNTVFGGLVGGLVAAITRDENESFGSAFLRGAVTGAIAGAALDICIATGGIGGVVIAGVGGAISAVLDTGWEAKNNGNKASAGDYIINGILGFGFNALFGIIGRGSQRMIGQGFKEVMNAIWANTVNSVTNRSGHFLLRKALLTGSESLFASAVQSIMGKFYSLAFTE